MATRLPPPPSRLYLAGRRGALGLVGEIHPLVHCLRPALFYPIVICAPSPTFFLRDRFIHPGGVVVSHCWCMAYVTKLHDSVRHLVEASAPETRTGLCKKLSNFCF